MQARNGLRSDISPKKTANLNPDEPPGVPKIESWVQFFEASYAKMRKPQALNNRYQPKSLGGGIDEHAWHAQVVGNLFLNPSIQMSLRKGCMLDTQGKDYRNHGDQDEDRPIASCDVTHPTPWRATIEVSTGSH